MSSIVQDKEINVSFLQENSQEVQVTQGKDRVILDVKQEFVIRCGESSITLHPDGDIVLRGKNIVSYSSETNKIKGASIKIN